MAATVPGRHDLGSARPTRARQREGFRRLDRDLPSESPPEWAQDFEQAIIAGAAGFREVTFFHRSSRTLLLTDLVVNLEAGKLPLHARFRLGYRRARARREGAGLFTVHP